MNNLLYAAFQDPADAEKATGALLDYGVSAEDISLVTKTEPVDEEHRRDYVAHNASVLERPVEEGERSRVGTEKTHKDNDLSAKTGLSTTTPEDASSAAVKGTGVGLGLGVLGALASLLVPGVGLVVGGGALATAIGGAIATTVGGAITGGVVGYLKDQGVPEKAAEVYHQTVESGGAIIAVRSPAGDVDENTIINILRKYNASNIQTYGAAAR